MNLRLTTFSVFLGFLTTLAVSAQSFSIGSTTDSQSWDIYGQSFTPSQAGLGFPSTPAGLSAVTLTDFSLAQFHTGTAPDSLLLVETSLLTNAPNVTAMISTVLADPAAYVIAESSAPTFTGGLLDGQFPADYRTLTYSFGTGVTLNAGTNYTALFSSGLGRVRVAGADTYTAGSIFDLTGYDPAFDAGFIANFTVAAIPEPSTYAVIAGAAALGALASTAALVGPERAVVISRS